MGYGLWVMDDGRILPVCEAKDSKPCPVDYYVPADVGPSVGRARCHPRAVVRGPRARVGDYLVIARRWLRRRREAGSVLP